MEQKKELSVTQLMVLAWSAALAPAAELLPRSVESGGAAGWLSPLFALPPLLIIGWLLARAAERDGLCGGLKRVLGPVPGRCVLLLYMFCAAILAGRRLGHCALRLSAGGSRDGSVWFFLGIMTLTALWMGWGRLAAFGRTAQALLAILITAAGVVLLLALLRVDWTLLMPGEEWIGRAVPVGLSAAELLAPGLYAGFLMDRTDCRRGGETFLWWTAAGCLLLTIAQGIVQGCLGAVLSAQMESPFFLLAQSVGVEGAFQRVESLVITVWSAADLCCAVLLLAANRALAAEISGGKTVEVIEVAGAAAAIGTAAGRVLGWPERETVRIREDGYALLLLFLVPALLTVIFDAQKGKKKKDSISCGKIRKKNGRYRGAEKK